MSEKEPGAELTMAGPTSGAPGEPGEQQMQQQAGQGERQGASPKGDPWMELAGALDALELSVERLAACPNGHGLHQQQRHGQQQQQQQYHPSSTAQAPAHLEQQLRALEEDKERIEQDRQEMARQQGHYKGVIAKLEGSVASSERRLRQQAAELQALKEQNAKLSFQLAAAKGQMEVTPDRCRAAAQQLQAEADRAQGYARTNEAQVRKLKLIMEQEAREMEELVDFTEQERLMLLEKEAGLEEALGAALRRSEAAVARLAESADAVTELEQQLVECKEQLSATLQEVQELQELNQQQVEAVADAEARVGQVTWERDAAAANLQKAERELSEVSDYSNKMLRQVRFISHLLEKHSTSLAKVPELQNLARSLRSVVATSSSAIPSGSHGGGAKGDDRGVLLPPIPACSSPSCCPAAAAIEGAGVPGRGTAGMGPAGGEDFGTDAAVMRDVP